MSVILGQGYVKFWEATGKLSSIEVGANSCSFLPRLQGMRCFCRLSFCLYINGFYSKDVVPSNTQRIHRIYFPGISTWNNWASYGEKKSVFLRRLWILAAAGQSVPAKKTACSPDLISLPLWFSLCLIFSFSLKIFRLILCYSSFASFLEQN